MTAALDTTFIARALDGPAGPNLFLLGAMRCGTTSIHRMLAQHPDIHMCEPKEPHFFGSPGSPPNHRGPGDDQLNARTVWRLDDYVQLFTPGFGCRFRGEASASYLHTPAAIDNLRAAPGSSRFVIVLRHPVERARSAHAYNRQRGREPIADAMRAIAEEPKRREAGWSPMFHYVGASRYADAVAHAFDALGRDRVKVLLHDDVARDVTAVMKELFGWLGLPPAPVEPAVLNRSGTPRSAALQRALAHGPVKRHLKRWAPTPLVRRLEGLRERNLDTRPLDARSRAALAEQLSADVGRLELVLGRQLPGSWKT
jgi:hypothetical protein